MVRALFLLILVSSRALSQAQPALVRLSDSLEVIRLSEHCRIAVTYSDVAGFGRVTSNGIIYRVGNQALLVNTPMTEPLTRQLLDYVRDSLRVTMTTFVANHWHDDGIGGLRVIHAAGIPSYANQMTIDIARSKGLPVPQHGFTGSKTFGIGSRKVVCSYFGAGHSTDQVVVWFPAERILFGGCMIKDLSAKTLGNTRDGDLKAWPETVRKVKAAYPSVKTVIPGHGPSGGPELLTHTEQLLKNR